MSGWKRKLTGMFLVALGLCCVLLPRDYHGSPPDWVFALLVLFFLFLGCGFLLLITDGTEGGHFGSGNWPT